MKTKDRQRSSGEAVTGPDPSCNDLYRIGGSAAFLFVLLVMLPLVLLVSMPQPPLSGGAAMLQYIASHRLLYIIELLSFVGLSVPAMIVFLALYAALKHLNKSYAALGALVGIASEVIALAYNSSPPSLNSGLVYLSDHSVESITAAQRTAFATSAEGLIAVSNAVNAAGILTALGILVLSLVMLKGTFPKWIAIVGIITGALGMASEALREMIGIGYIFYGLLLPLWFLAVGWRLYRLGSSSEPLRVETPE